MINFVTGKPGGGKSYYAVRQLLFELENTERFIVTNLSLNMEEIAVYLHERCKTPIDLAKRVRLLTVDEVRRFWQCYPGLTIRGRCKALGADMPEVTDFSELESLADYPGTLFLIDEVHLYFSARDWQKTGVDCEFFFSQHRKLKSDVMLITQHCEKVDKNMRRNAQDFTVIRNMQSEKLWLGVSLGKTLRRATYLQQPLRNDSPMESGFFKLDVAGLGKLYNTAAGVGIAGRLDVRSKSMGRGWWVWALAIVGIIVAAYALPRLLGYGIAKSVKSLVSGAQSGMRDVVKVRTNVPPVAAVVATNVVPSSVGEVAKVSSAVDVSIQPVRLARVLFVPSRPNVTRWILSNGEVIGVRSVGFESGGEDWVQYRGVRYDRGLYEDKLAK